jgi:ATP-dependent DNA helicase RecQ
MEFGSLKLTDNGWTVLRGDKTVLGYLDQELDVAPFVDEPARTDDLTSDDRLFEILRSKRKELADETGVPPYVIFSDKTLLFVCTAGKIKLRNDPKEPAGLYEAARPKAHKC